MARFAKRIRVVITAAEATVDIMSDLHGWPSRRGKR